MVNKKDFEQRIRIFVEGQTDQVLIDFILRDRFSIQLNNTELYNSVIDCKGNGNLRNKLQIADSQLRTDNGGINVIVFDADSEVNNGGFDARLQQVQSTCANFEVPSVIFLFPNNRDNGDLESFYMSLAKSEYSFFKVCWDSMVECFENSGVQDLNMPKSAGMVFSYVDLLKEYRDESYYNKKTKRCYFKNDLWEFDYENNDNLKGLIQFLEASFA